MPNLNWTTKTVAIDTKVIVSPYACTEKRTWRAVAVVVDKRRPNKVKPIFKRKLFIERTPRAYMVKGYGLIIHPELYERLRRKLANDIMREEREAIASAFGLSQETLKQPSVATAATLEEAVRLAAALK